MDFARQFLVSRHTIQKIREELSVPSRSERIIERLKRMDLKELTIKELSDILHVKYQNLYKILTENDMQVKPDKRPVESLKKYQKERKQARLAREARSDKEVPKK
jgi:predicted transcriptional regulator